MVKTLGVKAAQREAVKRDVSRVRGFDKMSQADQTALRYIFSPTYQYIDDPTFDQLDAERIILNQPDAIPPADTTWFIIKASGDAEGGKRKRGRINRLGENQQRQLSQQFNYCRYRVARLKQELGDCAPITIADTKQLLRWYQRAINYRDRIMGYYLPLIFRIVRGRQIAGYQMDDLISECSVALIRAIELHDLRKGRHFLSYACEHLRMTLWSVRNTTPRYSKIHDVDFDPDYMALTDSLGYKREHDRRYLLEVLSDIIKNNRALLTPLERIIMTRRYGIGVAAMQLTKIAFLVNMSADHVIEMFRLVIAKLRHLLERVVWHRSVGIEILKRRMHQDKAKQLLTDKVVTGRHDIKRFSNDGSQPSKNPGGGFWGRRGLWGDWIIRRAMLVGFTSVSQLAGTLGVSRQGACYMIDHHEIPKFKIEALARLCTALRAPPDLLKNGWHNTPPETGLILST